MKKNWKTVLCGIFAMMMAVSLTACGGTEEDSSQSSEAETTAEESSTVDTETDADSAEAEDSDAADADTTDADSSSQADVVYGTYDIEAEDGVDQACADVIKAYFTAIEEQTFEDYKATLYDYYYNVYDSWLQDNYGYGMETTMEQMHQTLLDSAGGDNLVITGVSVRPSTSEGVEATNSEGETEATEDLPTQYLHIYEELLGEGFADEVKKDVSNALVISFTMKGTVDGGEEKTIMEGYDLMMVEKDGAYYILG